MNSVRPTKRFITVAAAALLVPLLLFWLGVVTRSQYISRLLSDGTHTVLRDALPTIALPSLALALGAWELTRQGGPRRKDLLVVVLGFAGLAFIVIVGYLASEGRFLAGR